MTTATLQSKTTSSAEQAANAVVQKAVKLQATTAAICGSVRKRWSIVWSK